jgi:magnesium chelatase subunit D
VAERGILASLDGGVGIVCMAERLEASAGARLTAVMDAGEVVLERDGLAARAPARLGIIALDEGLSPEERAPDALADRLAFHVDLSALAPRAILEDAETAERVARAKAGLPVVAGPDEAAARAFCEAALALGLSSLRSPLLAVRAARAHAALRGSTRLEAEDAAVAVRLVLAPRALSAPAGSRSAEADPEEVPAGGLDEDLDEDLGEDLEEVPEDLSKDVPQEASDPAAAPSPEAEDPQTGADESQEARDPAETDRLVQAVRAALPENLLEAAAQGLRRPARSRPGRGGGASALSSRRGRPLGPRRGILRSGDRLDLLATLRAAAPWQRLRPSPPPGARLSIRPEDFRILRFAERQEATIIVAVDASGSAAAQRLAEAKGAVELLLAKAYVSRARVAVIAFRNTSAEVLLAPTRSLARAKRSLADLPGGGGTPLAAGLDAAFALAMAEKTKDRTPLVVILTDGRANIGRAGSPGRALAESDALASCGRFREQGLSAAFVDTSPRPAAGGDRFARAMGAVYAPLPYADAASVSGLVASLRREER